MGEFTMQISSLLDIGLNRSLVGLIAYSNSSNLIFNLLEHNSNEHTLLSALRYVPYILRRILPQWIPNTGKALRHLRTSADHEMGLREGRPHVAIVFTDGISSNRRGTIREANRLHIETDYHVFAVGIGYVGTEELAKIATSPLLAIVAQGFTEAAIQKVEQNVSQQLCQRQCKLLNKLSQVCYNLTICFLFVTLSGDTVCRCICSGIYYINRCSHVLYSMVVLLEITEVCTFSQKLLNLTPPSEHLGSIAEVKSNLKAHPKCLAIR